MTSTEKNTKQKTKSPHAQLEEAIQQNNYFRAKEVLETYGSAIDINDQTTHPDHTTFLIRAAELAAVRGERLVTAPLPRHICAKELKAMDGDRWSDDRIAKYAALQKAIEALRDTSADSAVLEDREDPGAPYRSTGILELLFEHGANPLLKDSTDRTARIAASESPAIVAYLKLIEPSWMQRHPESRQGIIDHRALHDMFRAANDASTSAALDIQQRKDLRNEIETLNKTAQEEILKEDGSAQRTQLLLKQAGILTEKLENMDTFVTDAHYAMVDSILKQGTPPDAAMPKGSAYFDGYTLLTLAAHLQDTRLRHIALDNGANPNAPDARERLPLVTAYRRDDLGGFMDLLNKGADVMQPEPNGGKSAAEYIIRDKAELFIAALAGYKDGHLSKAVDGAQIFLLCAKVGTPAAAHMLVNSGLVDLTQAVLDDNPQSKKGNRAEVSAVFNRSNVLDMALRYARDRKGEDGKITPDGATMAIALQEMRDSLQNERNEKDVSLLREELDTLKGEAEGKDKAPRQRVLG